MQAQLHEIWPAGFYCGPSVIAAITGVDCRDARAWINAVRHRPHNQGVLGLSHQHLIGALASRGYACVEVPTTKPSKPWAYGELPILSEVVADILDPSERYIISVTKHYVAVSERKIFDNRIRFGCPIEEHPSRRRRVRKIWRVS